MKAILNVAIVVALTTTLVISGGCAFISNDSTRTKAETTAFGCGLGAIFGGLTGWLLGEERGAAIGAAAGCGAGAAGGYAYGSRVAQKKAEYASKEKYLAELLREAKDSNRQAVTVNNALAGKIKQVSTQLARSGCGPKQRILALEKQLAEAKEACNRQLAYMNSLENSYNQALAEAGNSSQSSQLQAEVRNLKTNQQAAEWNNKKLDTLLNRC